MNQRGFVMIGVLALIPLLMAALAFSCGSAYLLKDHAELKHQCRSSLLSAQTGAATSLNYLLAINPVAGTLRLMRNLAIAMMEFPPTALFGGELLAMVTTMQRVVGFGQKALIELGRFHSKVEPALLRARQLVTIEGLRRSQGGVYRSIPWVTGKLGQFNLRTTHADSMTPDYQPERDFSRTQEASTKIQLPVSGLLPDWLRTLLNNPSARFSVDCAATVIKGEDGKWQATLSADRS